MSDRVFLSYDDAVAMLPEGDIIHTFRNGGLGISIIGAGWTRQDILDAIKDGAPELAGPGATGMGHGLVVFDNIGPLFIKTKEVNT